MELSSLMSLGLDIASEKAIRFKRAQTVLPAVPVIHPNFETSSSSRKGATVENPKQHAVVSSPVVKRVATATFAIPTARMFRADEPLPKSDDHTFTCMSYNVLLPNSKDGWWIYKYYRSPGEQSEWPARQMLLKRQIQEVAADIVCLQEVSDLSFEEDFGFMASDLKYESLLHEKNGRMRPATFWKKDAWQQVCALHKDRTLTVGLTRKNGQHKGKLLYVVNGHLSAGPSADRRLRQVLEALESIAKESKKQGVDTSKTPIIVCGDFNSQGSTAVRELLTKGTVTPDFREHGDPTEKGQQGKQITSKTRSQTIGVFADASSEVFGDSPPATILASQIDSKMLHEDGSPTPALLEAVKQTFYHWTGNKDVMTRVDAEKWLLHVNRALGRGSEFRSAMAAFERAGCDAISFDDFLGVYLSELAEGKFWGVEHDLRESGGHGLAVPDEGPCQLRFDYIYYLTSTLRLCGTRDTLTEDEKQRVFGPPWEVLPNSWHPSDHLPVISTFEFNQ